MSKMEGGMLDRSRMNENRNARLAAENAAAAQAPKAEVLDRSKMTETRDARIEAELAQAGKRPKEEVLDRTLMHKQRDEARDAEALRLKKTIEERLSAVEEKVGTDQPLSKEGLLNRNFGK